MSFTDAQGAVRKIDWALASAPESRQMLAKHAQIQEQLAGPFCDRVCGKGSKTDAAEEAEEAASEEGVARDGSGSGNGAGG